MYFDPYVFGGMATGMGGMLDQMGRLSNNNRELQRYIESTNDQMRKMVREYEKLSEAYKELQRINENLLKDEKSTNTNENYKIINNCDDWISFGDESFNQKKYNNAINAYNKAIEINSHNFIAWYNLGKVLDSVNKKEEAIQAYSNVFEILDKYYFDSWNQKRIILKKLKKQPLLNLEYDKIIQKLATEYEKNMYQKGHALIELERYDEALHIFNKIIQFEGTYYNDALYFKGEVLFKLEKNEEGLKFCKEALHLIEKEENIDELDMGLLLRDLSKLLKSHGEFEEAKIACNKAIELNPDWDFPWLDLGDVNFSMGRYRDALMSYEKGIQIMKKSYDLKSIFWIGKGNSLSGLHLYEEGLRAYEEAIKIANDANGQQEELKNAWNCKANNLKILGRNQEAAQAFAIAESINKN